MSTYPYQIGDKPTGRPSKLTPDLQERICAYVAAGNYITTACRAVGISNDTIEDWRRRAAAGEELFVAFAEAWERAQAEAEASRVAIVKECGDKGNWLAAMTHLERRHPERWARQDRLQIEQRSVQELVISVQFSLPPGLEHSTGQVVAGPPATEGEYRELGPGEVGPDTPKP